MTTPAIPVTRLPPPDWGPLPKRSSGGGHALSRSTPTGWLPAAADRHEGWGLARLHRERRRLEATLTDAPDRVDGIIADVTARREELIARRRTARMGPQRVDSAELHRSIREVDRQLSDLAEKHDVRLQWEAAHEDDLSALQLVRRAESAAELRTRIDARVSGVEVGNRRSLAAEQAWRGRWKRPRSTATATPPTVSTPTYRGCSANSPMIPRLACLTASPRRQCAESSTRPTRSRRTTTWPPMTTWVWVEQNELLAPDGFGDRRGRRGSVHGRSGG